MKKVLLIIFPSLLFSSSYSQTPDSVILLLNIGQSNVVGRASPDGLNEVPFTPGTFWYKQSSNSLEPLIDGTGEGISHATERSMNPELGKRLKELTGYNVIIVPAGVGNTFIRSWMKEDNSLYTRAKQMWQDAISYCAANNITIVDKYAHWLQGENDAGVTETDGYYVMLNQLANDLVSDIGVEKVFATRIGYDPNYTAAVNSEKIMKAQKILAYNNPSFVMASYAPPTFTYSNGKMSADLTHHALLGLNEEAEDIAQAIQYYRTTGNKIPLTENLAALQNVTSGYINLTPVWNFDFNGNTLEQNDNVKLQPQGWTPSYTSDGIIIDNNKALVTSRPFSSSTFTIETRFRLNKSLAETCVIGPYSQNYSRSRFIISNDNNSGQVHIEFGTLEAMFSVDLTGIDMSQFHTFKFTQANGVLRIYVDSVQRGIDFPSTGTLSFSWIGSGYTQNMDMDGVMDYFKTKNTVDNISALPVKFKSFKATNIK